MSKHAMIKETILKKIKSGEYQPGDRLQTEKELCVQFDVSRTTVRIALEQLEKEGYLDRVRGRGTFIAERKVTQALTQTVKRYSDQVAVQGKTAENQLIDLQVIPADSLAVHFKLEPSAPVQKVERIRRANMHITQYEVSYIPWDAAPGITKEDAEYSLYSTLQEKYKVPVTRTVEHVEIILADDRIAGLLDYDVGAPCFYIETTTYSSSDRVIEYSHSYFRGDITNFTIERHYGGGEADESNH
ncbi:GntR family transcriptional regulator [Corticicoccus populi]|uniref:GntR family transcriptional regulator n=1 Tax=Corticicoccus populi TaxID=1812821 RepID=A0ABW5WWJ9_9STAP